MKLLTLILATAFAVSSSADKFFSNTVNSVTATATDPITVADDIAIMLDEGQVHTAAVKPVFSNLLLRGGVVLPRNNKDSFGEVEGGCRPRNYGCGDNSMCCSGSCDTHTHSCD